MMGVKKFMQEGNMRRWMLLASALVACLFIIGLTQALRASEQELLPPDLSQSAKTVDREEAKAGSTLEYNITVKNTGNQFAIASVTDTLVADLTYVPGSLSVQNGGSDWEANGNVIDWRGTINGGAEVKITFRAVLADDVAVGAFITNTANIYLDGQESPAATPNVGTTIVDVVVSDRTKAYLPLVIKGLPSVTVNAISRPTKDNSWTVSWRSTGSSSVTSYEIQEANNAAFSGASTLNVGLTLARAFSHSRSFNNVYYYRVRALIGSQVGPWSNVETVAADYRDDYTDAASGWAMRRTSSESNSEWELSYRTDQILQLIMKDKNEYMIASPLRELPTLPVNIETDVSFNEFNGTPVSDRQAFAIIFGANWNGETCPNGDFSSCFTSYYRLRFRWRDGTNDFWEYRLDWVKGHDSTDEPIVDTLIDWNQIKEKIDPNASNEVDVRIEPDGGIKIFIKDVLIHRVNHPRIITEEFGPYFGVEVSTKEKANARVKFRYFEVKRVD
jgi:uncharacterized repeat protein (TIGR01451 family)